MAALRLSQATKIASATIKPETSICTPRLQTSSISLLPSTIWHCPQIACVENNRRQAISVHATSVKQTVPYFYSEPCTWPTAEEMQLQTHDLESVPYVDLIVAGAGPSGVVVAERVAQAGYSVCVIDVDPMAKWINNYGVWVDEFQAMGLEDCLHIVWPKAKVWLDNHGLGEQFLNRPFGRVNRPKLKRKLLSKCKENGVTFLYGKVDKASHANGSSTVSLLDGRKIMGCMVLDATGHAHKLIEYNKQFNPGFQGAYGIIAEVESHPFALDTMLFMDWRDDHLKGSPEMRAANEKTPTFLYAMPFSKNKVFLEETSLVARPAVGFEELKQRLEARLKWLGIKVNKIEEEEYCLIPMGGVLPKHPQRVVAVGGSAGMVHPSTGFMMARMLGMAPTVADAIVEQLARPADRADLAGPHRRPVSEAEAGAMSEAVWAATWPVERIQQRAFFTFGMDILLSLNLFQTREFFMAFFTLSDFHWHGFLSTRLSFTQLVGFGLALFVNASNDAKTNLLVQGLPGLFKMLLEISPTLSSDYYPGVRPVKDIKAAHDAKGASASQPRERVVQLQQQAVGK
ncbi:hypothetical protein CEUSTIGMA_g10621.t1 [Chlamydomonas eustigma]|uniref:lycopene beta-cyclase n=1 Tax=Chlamydomonas eustigma TaxID=1157962 RepID=A0A250XJD3_9CHLO|nr:hypothetical protein CEUSTIGMA_g10621.t1 [Chlamydomonas eustigma]|eukprot:GAX83195.1 hypothetical protein CEUSTIGMA_g10621.t1 [Chlamydomonas eustigma]